MKKKSSAQSGIFSPRGIVVCAFFSVAALLCVGSFFSFATPAPTSATLSTSNRTITYTDSTGSAPNLNAIALGGKPDCTAPMSCSIFTLTIDASVGTAAPGYDPTKFQISINESWGLQINDYDTFVEDAVGNVIAQNLSTADPETITLPTNTTPGVYSIILVMVSGAPVPYTGTITLQPKPAVSGNCVPPDSPACAPPRYINYPAGSGQANFGEPSIGVDWNPNVASLKDTTSPIFTTGIKRLNTGGVAFFTSGQNEWRANFDDCPSPALNQWEDVSSTFTQNNPGFNDPIGFVDHYSSSPLGLAYPEPHTPGRVFTIVQISGQGNSLGSFSDTDGNSYLPGGHGGPGSGPDHETLGGGPYNPNSVPPPPPQASPYPSPAGSGSPNAIYYCSWNGIFVLPLSGGEAQCSRSDDGGQTFGPAIPIFQNPAQCTGGFHGHVKVAPDGTVYVANSYCGTTGLDGVAVSTDNGLTWTENNVPGSTRGPYIANDPSVGIGQNNVGKVGSTNTIYLGWISDDGHPHVADSHDRGVTWEHDTDVGALLAVPVTHGVFPVVVAGDDNRAAFGFLGTGDAIATSGTCDPYGTTLNCANIWHLYIATTYDGGAHWIPVDVTPNDPVQQGVVCLQGGNCLGGRNLLDFNDFTVDAEGRGLLGYADGCPNCGNTFTIQSSAHHGTIARQSGGRRLFSHFDPNPIEPVPPAAPQMIAAAQQRGGGALVSWLEPDNGGSTITGYNIYRSTTSGTETLLAHVSGETTTKYLDATPPVAPNVFYYAQAINTINGIPSEGEHCGEKVLGPGCLTNCGDSCTAPYLPVDGAGTAVTPDPTMGEMTIRTLNFGEPFTDCSDNSITFLMKVATMDPGGTGMAVPPPNGEWQILLRITDTNVNSRTIFVDMDTTTPTPEFSYGRRDYDPSHTTLVDTAVCTAGPTSTCPAISGNVAKDGTITIKLNVSAALQFPAPTATTGTAFSWDAFDVDLPLTGTRGVECRSSNSLGAGSYTMIFTFVNPLVSVNGAAIASGIASVSSSTLGPNANQYTVNLTSVSDQQYVSVALINAKDSTGAIGTVPGPKMGVLIGDVNSTGLVDGNDVSAVQGQARQTANSTNFRLDVNTTGLIDGNDVSLVQSKTRTSLPTPP